MTTVTISKRTLEELYNRGYTMPEMVNYFNENFGGEGIKFSTQKVKAIFENAGFSLRHKPRRSFEVIITDEEIQEEMTVEQEDVYQNPYLTENLI